jgi:acyl carrier protein
MPMSDSTTIKLKNIDSDDITDVLVKVEKSFGFKIDKTEFDDVKTFGQLCDIITNKIKGDNSNDCTTQQAFYKIRTAISKTLLIDKSSITADTALQELFPLQNRRQQVAAMEGLLGFEVKVFRPKYWVSKTLVLALLVSVVVLFIYWKAGIPVLIFTIIALRLADKFGKEFDLHTVGQLAEKISRENYLKSRRSSVTINRNEIAQKVREIFSKDLELDQTALTKEATFV